MTEREVTIAAEEGLHARPAAAFVKCASEFGADIQVIKGDEEASAKSLLAVLKLGARKGDTVTLRAEGEDAEEALGKLAELIESAAT